VRQIPADQLAPAQQAGGEIAYKLIDPSGTPRWIRQSALKDAVDANGKPADMHEARRVQEAMPVYTGDDRLLNTVNDLHQRGILSDTDVGFLHEAAATYSGLTKIIGKVFNGQGETSLARNADQLAGRENENLGQSAGGFLESAAEFLLGDEALKGLSYTERLAKIVPTLKAVEKSPILAKALHAAMQQGTVSGAQGYVKSGGDAGTAAEAALLGGGAAAAGETVAGGVGKFIKNNADTIENIGGVETPVKAELRNAKPTPQQTAGQESIRNVAKDVTRRNLEDLNQSRTTPEGNPALPARTGPYEFTLRGTGAAEETEGDSVVPARKKQIGTSLELRQPSQAAGGVETGETGGVRKVPKFQYLTGAKPDATPETVTTRGGGDIKTTDSELAYQHLKTINDTIESPEFDQMPAEQQQQLHEAKADMERQLGEHYAQVRANYADAGRPYLEPVDVQDAIRKTGSLSGARDAVEQAAQAGYRRYDDLTGGRVTAVRNQMKQAWQQYIGAAGSEELTAAEGKIAAADRAHQALMDELRGSVSAREIDGLDDAYRNSKVIGSVAEAVDSTFTGNDSGSARSWEYRGFNGNRMMANLNRVTRKLGRSTIEHVFGRENLDTLYQVAANNQTLAQRKAWGVAVKDIAKFGVRHASALSLGGLAAHAAGLPWEVGALGGEAVYSASKKVMDMVLANPKIAQNLIYALNYGARPENYVPLIAHMVSVANREQQQSTPEDENNEQQ
jgi:hypothetical protein